MIALRLRDRIDIVQRAAPHAVLSADVPAYVGTATTAMTTADGARIGFETGVRAIVAPRPFDPAADAIRWRGELYVADGAPMVRRRGARDHHVTIPLRRTVD